MKIVLPANRQFCFPILLPPDLARRHFDYVFVVVNNLYQIILQNVIDACLGVVNVYIQISLYVKGIGYEIRRFNLRDPRLRDLLQAIVFVALERLAWHREIVKFAGVGFLTPVAPAVLLGSHPPFQDNLNH